MVKIKICGLYRIQDIDMVNEVLPEYAGFVFAKSRRQVTASQASELKARLNQQIKAVGVFVNEAPEVVIKLCRDRIIDLIQLHGEEDEVYIQKIRNEVDNPIIKAIRVRNREDIPVAGQYSCEYMLFDSYHKEQYGGSGIAFDWSMLTAIDKPYFLAGGITIDNVERALLTQQPYAIDISSGVETDGFKDRRKLIDFVEKVRRIKL